MKKIADAVVIDDALSGQTVDNKNAREENNVVIVTTLG